MRPDSALVPDSPHQKQRFARSAEIEASCGSCLFIPPQRDVQAQVTRINVIVRATGYVLAPNPRLPALHLRADTNQILVGRDVQRAAVVAEREVRRCYARGQRAEVLALRRVNEHATRTGRPD